MIPEACLIGTIKNQNNKVTGRNKKNTVILLSHIVSIFRVFASQFSFRNIEWYKKRNRKKSYDTFAAPSAPKYHSRAICFILLPLLIGRGY